VRVLESEIYEPQSRHDREGNLDCFGDAGVAETHAVVGCHSEQACGRDYNSCDEKDETGE
jgi:hypothetical protein